MYFLSFGKCLRANIIRQNGARGGGRLGGLDQYSWGELEGGGRGNNNPGNGSRKFT